MSAYVLFESIKKLRYIARSSSAEHAFNNIIYRVQACGYAKKAATKGKAKGMVKEAVKGPEVCKDPVMLTSSAVGVNIFKNGQDPPLRPQEEYPEWLFQLNLGPPKKLSEMDPESHEYWKLLRKEHMWRFNKLHKGKKF